MSYQTDESIITAFKEEAFEKGIINVTVGNIAKRSKCARQTVYYHYEGVFDLIKELVNEDHTELQRELGEKTRWKYEALNLLTNLKRDEWLYKDVESSKYRDTFNEFLVSVCHDKITQYLLASCTNSGTDKSREVMTKIITFSFSGFILDWINKGFNETPEEIMRELNILCGSSMHKMIEDYLGFRPSKIPAEAY